MKRDTMNLNYPDCVVCLSEHEIRQIVLASLFQIQALATELNRISHDPFKNVGLSRIP